MAAASDAERATGYVAGGISPVGQKRGSADGRSTPRALRPRHRVRLGGRRGLDLGIAPADLVAVTGATTARIGR